MKMKQEAHERGHLMTPFYKSQYANTLYEISECKYCGMRIIIKDGQCDHELDGICSKKGGRLANDDTNLHYGGSISSEEY